MSPENAIEVKNVVKIYKLYNKPIDRLKESMNPTHKSYQRFLRAERYFL